MIDSLKGLFDTQKSVASSGGAVAGLAFLARFIDFDFMIDPSEISDIAGQLGL